MRREARESQPKKRRRRTIAAGILFGLMLATGTALYGLASQAPGEPGEYDATRIAASETRMWKAYYEGNHLVVAHEAFGLLRSQFGLSYKDAFLAGKNLALAARAFLRTTQDYGTKVLPHLTRAYGRIRDARNEAWDPREVARAELDWWIARRTPGRNTPEQVGKAIAHEYALLNGSANPDLERAGLLRAQAAHLRDQNETTPDWQRIGTLLEESYIYLVRGTRPSKDIHEPSGQTRSQ